MAKHGRGERKQKGGKVSAKKRAKKLTPQSFLNDLRLGARDLITGKAQLGVGPKDDPRALAIHEVLSQKFGKAVADQTLGQFPEASAEVVRLAGFFNEGIGALVNKFPELSALAISPALDLTKGLGLTEEGAGPAQSELLKSLTSSSGIDLFDLTANDLGIARGVAQSKKEASGGEGRLTNEESLAQLITGGASGISKGAKGLQSLVEQGAVSLADLLGVGNQANPVPLPVGDVGEGAQTPLSFQPQEQPPVQLTSGQLEGLPGFQTGGGVQPIGAAPGNPLSGNQTFQAGAEGQTGQDPLLGDIRKRASEKFDTGQLDQLSGKAGAFDPFGGALGGRAKGTLDDFLQSGRAVDVGGITEAAQSQAQRSFGDFLAGTDEQLGALGLASSSSRDQILAREAGRAAQGVGEAGLRANVAAQEAARNRQQAGVDQFGRARGQNLSGIGIGVGGAGSSASTRAGRQNSQDSRISDAFNNLLNSQNQELNRQQQARQNAPSFPSSSGRISRPSQPIRAPGGGLGGGSTSSNSSGRSRGRRNARGSGLNRVGGFGQSGGKVSDIAGFAHGGRVDFDDFLSNTLFGETFNRGLPQEAPGHRTTSAADFPNAGTSELESLQLELLRDQLKGQREGRKQRKTDRSNARSQRQQAQNRRSREQARGGRGGLSANRSRGQDFLTEGVRGAELLRILSESSPNAAANVLSGQGAQRLGSILGPQGFLSNAQQGSKNLTDLLKGLGSQTPGILGVQEAGRQFDQEQSQNQQQQQGFQEGGPVNQTFEAPQGALPAPGQVAGLPGPEAAGGIVPPPDQTRQSQVFDPTGQGGAAPPPGLPQPLPPPGQAPQLPNQTGGVDPGGSPVPEGGRPPVTGQRTPGPGFASPGSPEAIAAMESIGLSADSTPQEQLAEARRRGAGTGVRFARSNGVTRRLQQQGGIVEPFQIGGEVDGPAVPPDQVPILAQGGEGIIPVGLMNELRETQSGDPLVNELQQLMFKKDERTEGAFDSPMLDAIQKKEHGGEVDFRIGADPPTDLAQLLAGAEPQGVPSFDNASLQEASASPVGGGGGFLSAERTPEQVLAMDRERRVANAQRRASALSELAAKSPKGARIQELAKEAQADAERLVEQDFQQRGEEQQQQQQAELQTQQLQIEAQKAQASTTLAEAQAGALEGGRGEQDRKQTAAFLSSQNRSAQETLQFKESLGIEPTPEDRLRALEEKIQTQMASAPFSPSAKEEQGNQENIRQQSEAIKSLIQRDQLALQGQISPTTQQLIGQLFGNLSQQKNQELRNMAIDIRQFAQLIGLSDEEALALLSPEALNVQSPAANQATQARETQQQVQSGAIPALRSDKLAGIG